jgi:transcriptional regulator with GAF, ATPase, and Fis domain
MKEPEMSRESSVVRSLVDLAATLTDDFDVVEMLTGLTDRCVDLLAVSAAGVMLASPDGTLRLIASSSEAMRIVELFELQAEEGPCLDAYRTGEQVEHENLRAGSGRWPRFATVAVEAGFHSALAMPLKVRHNTIGAMNLFSFDQIPMEGDDVLVARAFADLATISVVQHGVATEIRQVNEQLTHALESRVLIEQAKGVIFERAGVDMAQAFDRLRNYSRTNNLRLTQVAQAAIDGTLPRQAWELIPPPARS